MVGRRLQWVLGALLVIPYSVCTLDVKVVQNKYVDKDQLGSGTDRCEFLALRLGSELADTFNAPGYDQDWNHRLYQDFLVENLGFSPWIAGGINGKTTSGKDSHQLHSSAGWVGTSIEKSPYEVLNHKWIYMLGDSTTRQIWASFAAPFKGNNFVRNAKEWTRHYCNKQPHRHSHPKGGFFEEEGWGGPCGVNEVTCHISGYGDRGVLTFDWKHFPYEDYDEYLWGATGPWIAGFEGEGVRRPDLLTVQMGLHSCWHSSPQGLYSKHLTGFNSTMNEKHRKDVWTLMGAIRKAVDHEVDGQKRNHTTVIVVTSGFPGIEENGDELDHCILRMNRVVAQAARAHGFAVLERGEIERRLTFKSMHSNFKNIPIEMHLTQPAQNIVATALLHLYACLEENQLSRSQGEHRHTVYPVVLQRGENPDITTHPLHTPPS